MTGAPLERSAARTALLVGATLLAAAFAVFWPALRGEWLWDDNLDITENPLLRDAAGLARIWFQPTTLDYYPLKFTVQWLQWQLWGAEPLGYHITNVVLHAVSGFLLWRIFLRLGLCFAFAAALLFVVHPLTVQSVAWIAELKNALSLPPLLLSFLAWLDFETSATRRAYFRSLAWFLAALLCKTSVVMFPVTLLLFLWWKHDRLQPRDLVRLAPFFALSLAFGLLALSFHGSRSLGGETLALGGAASRLALAGTALAFYAGKTLWPVGLLPVYPRWSIDPFHASHLLPWLVLAAAIVLGWHHRATWGRHALFGLGWFVLHLAPVLGAATISFMRFTWVMDHLTYVALPGALALVVAGADVATRRLRPPPRLVLPLAAALLAAALAFLAREHAALFRRSLDLWGHNARENPTAWVAHHNLGLARAATGDAAGAARAYEAALALKPDYFEPRMNLGNLHRQQGRLPEAIAQLEAAVQLSPRTATGHYNLALAYLDAGRPADALPRLDEALRLKPSAAAHDLRGELHRQSGNAELARRDYLAALQLDPASADAHHHLGALLASAGHPAEAVPLITAALHLRPNNPAAHNALAAALVALQRTPEALPHLERALALDSGFADARFNLAILLTKSGRAAEALPHFETLQQQGHASLKLHYNHAAALAAAGRHADAVTHFERALALDGSFAQIHAELARSLLALGRRDAAARHAARARELDPALMPVPVD